MEACEKFHGQVVIPCTACRYCCEGCPVQINIPEYLKVYNAGKVEGQQVVAERMTQVESKGKPSDCIACGACTGHCPQGIDVPSVMKELSKM